MSEPEPTGPVGSRVMRLRYRGVCEACAAELPAGITAVYDRERRTVRCVECPTSGDNVATTVLGGDDPGPAATPSEGWAGTAGGSAQRIYERRSARDRAQQEARVAEDRARRQQAKADHPILGRIASALVPKEVVGPEPQHITAWKTGAEGEQRVGSRLDEWAAAGGGLVLHDRRKPGSKANIDHVAVAPSGIYVIDAKRYEGKVETVNVGGWWSTDIRLRVRGRDQTKLTVGVNDQVAAVASALAAAWPREVRPSVQGILCFIDSLWGWLARPFEVNDVMVAWPAATIDILNREGPWSPSDRADIAAALTQVLRPA